MSLKVCYTSCPSLSQCTALDTMDLLFVARGVRSRAAGSDVLALLLMIRVARYLAGVVNYLYQVDPSQIDCYTDAGWAGDVTTRLSTTAGALMHGDHLAGKVVVDAESHYRTEIWSSERSIYETHLSQSWRDCENTGTT